MIAIFGASGQVGGALGRVLGKGCISLGQAEADFSVPAALPAVLERIRPHAVINAAAYTQVDRAESEERLAFAVNAESPAAIARWCAGAGVPLVHYSTDYVFGGTGSAPHTEEETPHPLNVYGASKRAGEEAVAAAGGRCLILRTSWVYDECGHNFLNTMLRLGKEREKLSVVADQYGAPTYAGHLAQATVRALEAAAASPQFPGGIYHLCHAGETTWHGFAEAIFREARARGERLAVRETAPIRTEDYPTPARRPRNSRLDCGKAARTLGIALPAWQEGLAACMKHKYAA